MTGEVATGGGQGNTNSAPVVDDAAAKAAADKATSDAATAKAASDKAAADAAAAAAGAAKTPEQIAADKAAAEAAAATKTPEQLAAEKAAADAEAAKGKAPEKYEIKIPDGAKDMLDDADLKDLEGKARAKGLTNEQLQAVVDARADELAAQSTAFRAQTEADPTIGGDKLPETQRLAKVAMDRLHPESTPEGKDFRKFLTKTGYGNHVQVVKHFATLGKMMAEDGHVQGGGAKPAKDAASTLYDKTPTT
jgi:hypothetical protein